MITKFLASFQEYRSIPILIGGKRLSATVADTPIKQMIGLMYREKLRSNECMLFVFGKPARYSIWMKHMLIPIDVIWLDRKKRIVTIMEGLKPAKALDFTIYKPAAPSKFVVELPAGYVKKNRITKKTEAAFS